MSLVGPVPRCLRRYAVLEGRARRWEYWGFVVFLFLGGLITGLIDSRLFAEAPGLAVPGVYGQRAYAGPAMAAFFLAMFLPHLAAAVRRLHDRDISAAWLLVVLIPFIGPLILAFFLAGRGSEGANSFGPDPRGRGPRLPLLWDEDDDGITAR